MYIVRGRGRGRRSFFLFFFFFFFFLFHGIKPAGKKLMSTETSCHFVYSFWKIHCFTFFPYKSMRDQIRPCRKIGQGQPRVIIWANFPFGFEGRMWDMIVSVHDQCLSFYLVVFEHPMMHTKFQGHRPFGSREGFYQIWAWRPTWLCDQDCLITLTFPHPIEAPYEIWFWLAQCFLRRCLKSVDDDGRRRRTTEAYLSYKLTKWPFGSDELMNSKSR